MGKSRKSLSKILEGLAAIIILPCAFGILISSLGLLLQLTELVTGDKDFSKWMFMSIAEQPTVDLLVWFGICSGIILFISLIVTFFEKKGS